MGNLILSAFKNSSSDSVNYSRIVSNVWGKQKANLSLLYETEAVIAYQETSKIEYFIFDRSQTGLHSKNKISLDLVIVSPVDSIDYSINTVVDNIKQTLGK